ncbi:type IV pilin protein [Sphaerotilus microaerophilus]|uniref:Type 4 fimbrial biogenesis protein PilE n=1 Tax=Sphaerotilus microaerophilus TaxID=2914710 RepID=A0ABM7YJP8_9BURK|nr:type IV pilin protein [Sphaerotilus sp. FB-5]BDI04536.1 type 4 fimbrial biogenesis protein PilE [Sphaerotilus sp. FB-5]
MNRLHRTMPSAALRRVRGFTLVEMMIVIAVIGILTAVALPSYRQHVANSRRADARAAILSLAQVMERWYTERGTYVGATVGASGIYPSASPQGYYTMSITAQDATTFTVRAAPTGAQTGDACGSYTYTQAGTRGVTGGSRTVAQCW